MSRAKGNGLYKVKWDREGRNFSFDTDDGIHFYGWWRYTKINKTDTIIHAVDIYAKREHEDPDKYMDVCVNSLTYDKDPRDNIPSLNADICAAANRWFFENFGGEAIAIDRLIKQAKFPTIHVNQISTIDTIIMRLKEMRHTAILSGGTRVCELRGDKQYAPLLVSINVTDQAIALEGKVPNQLQGAMVDSALKSGRGKDVRSGAVLHKADPATIQSLVQQLKATKDKATGRKIRALLRSYGHRGGARSS